MKKLLVAFFLLLIPQVVFGAWDAPIGIPDPTFPSDLDVARPSLPDPWNENTAGFYYIKNGGTNAGNGYPADPKDSIPTGSLSAGDVVVIEVGTEYPDNETVSDDGTSESPIWIMSSSDGTKADCTGAWSITGDYIIIDDIEQDTGASEGSFNVSGGNYVMLRDVAVTFTHDTSNGAGIGISGGASYVVIYSCEIGPLGDWTRSNPASDMDQHGVKVSGSADHIWIVDNAFEQVMGDGVQVGDGAPTNTPEDILYIYIGRNTAYQMCQSGFWTKNATDVIMSENTVHTINEDCPGGEGQGMGGQYDGTYVWFLYNTIYDAAGGICINGSDDGDGGPWYAIGNVIYNIESSESTGDTCNAYNYGALKYRNSGGFNAFYNTVYNVDSFLCVVPISGVVVRNNIFSSPKTNDCPCINVQEYPTMDYNLYSQAAITFGWDGSGSTADSTIEYNSVSTFAAGETEEQNSPTPGDPVFVNAPSDFNIQTSSPAKDVGTLESALADFNTRYSIEILTDLNDTARPKGAGWDIGSYEYDISGSIALTGTLFSNNDESDVVDGDGFTVIATATSTEFVATAGDDNAITTAIIQGLAGSASWNTCMDSQDHNDLTCTTTVCTLVIDDCGAYAIDSNDTITWTFPSTAVVSETEIVATPTVEIIAQSPVSPPPTVSNIGSGGLTISNEGSGGLTVVLYE